MRDAYGGTFMITLIMVFLVIIIAFTAVIANVAKTFRVKNGIINIIEQDDFAYNDQSTIDDIDLYLNKASYKVSVDSSKCDGNFFSDYGYCVVPMCGKVKCNSGDDKADYYKVTTYVSISLPFFGINMTLPVSGETKSIERLD